MDPVTGNEVSGLTITNTVTAETHASLCGGVSFTPLSPPNNYSVTAGSGTDCTTLEANDYDASPTNSEPAGSATITLTRSIETRIFDSFTDTPGTELSLHVPDVGGPWIQDIAGPTFIIGPGIFINLPSTGLTRYHCEPISPVPDITANIRYNGDLGYSDTDRIMVRFDPATGNCYFAEVDPSGTLSLGKSIAGIETILGTHSFAMPDISTPPGRLVSLSAIGTTITVTQNGGFPITVTDTDIATPGFAGAQGNRAVGQPVHLSAFSVQW